MPWITVAKCDICGRLRGESNHWWSTKVTGDMGFYVSVLEMTQEPGQLICGEKCLVQALTNYIKEINCKK